MREVFLTKGYRRRCPHVLVGMLVEHLLEFIAGDPTFVHQHMVVGRSRCTLDRTMRAQVKIILEWMGHILLNQCARHRIAVLISGGGASWEEPDVMSLLSHHHGKFNL